MLSKKNCINNGQYEGGKEIKKSKKRMQKKRKEYQEDIMKMKEKINIQDQEMKKKWKGDLKKNMM